MLAVVKSKESPGDLLEACVQSLITRTCTVRTADAGQGHAWEDMEKKA
jgi:hypothetical protein